jgi:hypothetical protein
VGTLHEARLRHAAYYSTVLRTAQKFYDRGGKNIDRGLELFDLEWGNIALGQAWAEKHAQEDDVAVVLCSAYANLGATMHMLRLHPQERVRWLQTALNAIQLSNYRGAEATNSGANNVKKSSTPKSATISTPPSACDYRACRAFLDGGRMESLRVTSCMAENADFICRQITRYIAGRLKIAAEFINDIPWQERERLLDAGQIHVCWICGLPYVWKADRPVARIELLVAPVMSAERYRNSPIYFSDVVVHRDSDFETFSAWPS